MPTEQVQLKVEIINREIVKPTSPIPHDLKHFKISLLDQLAGSVYVPLLLFYPKQQLVDVDDSSSPKSIEGLNHRLRTSLSETLTRFYPLAGRLKDNASIDCNDEGAEFIEARVNCLLSDFLKQPNSEALRELVPNSKGGFLLLVQNTLFECGGIAIGVSISHRIADASSISTFIKSWSATATAFGGGSHDGQEDQAVVPHLVGDSLLQPSPDFPLSTDIESPQIKCVTRRFVFDAPKIAALKLKAASETVPQPTRVEAVMGLIWKCAISASRSSGSDGTVKNSSVLSQTVNLRTRFTPPLPKTSIGNFLGNFIAQTSTEDVRDVKLEGLVGQLREAKDEFSSNGVKRYQGENAFFKILEALGASAVLYKRQDIDFYICSSWSRFDLYDADFGWGKPKWVSIASLMMLNFIVLMDTKDGQGIEAWVTLTEPDMASFEAEPELLAFASLNPSVF